MRDLKIELQSLEGHEYDESHRRKAFDALKRIEGSNLFREIYSYEVLVCYPLLYSWFSMNLE